MYMYRQPAEISSFKDQCKQACGLNDYKVRKDWPSPQANKKLTPLLTIDFYNISP